MYLTFNIITYSNYYIVTAIQSTVTTNQVLCPYAI